MVGGLKLESLKGEGTHLQLVRILGKRWVGAKQLGVISRADRLLLLLLQPCLALPSLGPAICQRLLLLPLLLH